MPCTPAVGLPSSAARLPTLQDGDCCPVSAIFSFVNLPKIFYMLLIFRFSYLCFVVFCNTPACRPLFRLLLVNSLNTLHNACIYPRRRLFSFRPALATIRDCSGIPHLGSCRSFLLCTLRKMFSEKLCPTARLKPEDFLKMRPAFWGFLSVLRISSLCPPYPIARCAVSALYLTLSATIVFPRSNSL